MPVFMKMLLSTMISVVLFMAPGGFWTNQVEAKPFPSEQQFYKTIDRIDIYIQVNQWNNASTAVNKLEQVFNRHRWKLQLLGDEGEIEDVLQSIHRIRAAVDEHDRSAARMELALLKQSIQYIYEF